MFLLSQRVHAALSSPWTEYVRYLPDEVFVPTMWHDHELPLLQGTSLEVRPMRTHTAGKHDLDPIMSPNQLGETV